MVQKEGNGRDNWAKKLRGGEAVGGKHEKTEGGNRAGGVRLVFNF